LERRSRRLDLHRASARSPEPCSGTLRSPAPGSLDQSRLCQVEPARAKELLRRCEVRQNRESCDWRLVKSSSELFYASRQTPRRAAGAVVATHSWRTMTRSSIATKRSMTHDNCPNCSHKDHGRVLTFSVNLMGQMLANCDGPLALRLLAKPSLRSIGALEPFPIESKLCPRLHCLRASSHACPTDPAAVYEGRRASADRNQAGSLNRDRGSAATESTFFTTNSSSAPSLPRTLRLRCIPPLYGCQVRFATSTGTMPFRPIDQGSRLSDCHNYWERTGDAVQ
jgi:hypothetical protein